MNIIRETSEQLRSMIRAAMEKAIAEKITGTPKKLPKGDRVVANVIYRDGTLLDNIYNVPQK